MGGAYRTHREKRNSYRVLVGELEGKKALEETDLGGKMIKWREIL
jgi:hypothetical protein